MADTPKVVSTAAPRYIHGIQSNVNASDAWLTPRIQENEQATLMDSYTDYGTTTVEGDLYVMCSSDGPTHHNSLSGRADADCHPIAAIGGATATRVLFGGASGQIAESADFTFDTSGNMTCARPVRFTDATASTSTTTGALVVTGGIGTGDGLYAGGLVRLQNTTASTSTTTGALVVSGGVGIAGAIYAGGAVRFTQNTASTSTTTGTLVVTGGLGVSGAVYGGSVGRFAAQIGTGVYTVATLPTAQIGDIAVCSDALVPFGLPIRADGATSSFTPHPVLVDNSVFYRWDWRGIHQLFPTSRTNLALWSEDFGNVLWQKLADGAGTLPVVTTDYSVAPDGNNTADRIILSVTSGSTTADRSRVVQAFGSYDTSKSSCHSIWMKTNDASTVTVQIVNFNSTVATVTVTPVWRRFFGSITPSASSSSFGIRLIKSLTSDFADLSVWGSQLEVGSVPTPYIPTTTTAVPVTDYTISGATITVSPTPASGTLIGVANKGGLVSYSSGAWRTHNGQPAVSAI